MPRLFEGVSLWPMLGRWLRTMVACAGLAALVWIFCRRLGIPDWNPWLSVLVMPALFAALYGGLLAIWPPDREALHYGATVWRQMVGRKRNWE